MKSWAYLLIILFLLFSNNLLSQNIQAKNKERNYLFIGAGFNLNSLNHSGLDFVVKRYNVTRQGLPGQFELTKKLDDIGWMKGYNFGFGWVNNRHKHGLFYTLNYQHGSFSARAEGYDATDTFRLNLRTLDMKSSLTNLSLGIGFIPMQLSFLDIGIGGEINMAFLNIKTKINNASFERLTSDLGVPGIGGSVYLLFNIFPVNRFPLFISIQPYMFFDLIQSDMSSVNKAINANTYTDDSNKDQMGNLTHLGLQVQINFCLFTRYNENRLGFIGIK